MYDINLSSRGAIVLFEALKGNKNLKMLDITHNAIADDACDAITVARENNNCLVTLSMSYNPLSSEVILKIGKCLKANNVLQVLGLPYFPQSIQEDIRCIQEAFNMKREIQLTICF